MEEEQRYLRFVLPGLTFPLALTAALALTSPWLVAHLLNWVSSNTAASVAAAAGALLSSGGLGFLFAQLYFGLPKARPDHTVTFEEFECPSSLEQTLGDVWHRASGKAKENESLWLRFLLLLTADTLSQDWVRKKHQAFVQREHAWDLAHYLWQIRVAPTERQLTRDVARLAARLAALGATGMGLASSFIAWMAWVVFLLAGSEPHTWQPDGQPELRAVGAVLAMIFVFLVPSLLLWWNLQRLKRYHRLAIHNGLVRGLKLVQ